MVDVPRVTLWQNGTTQWDAVGDLPAYTSLDVQVRFNDTGTWQLSHPWTAAAQRADTEQLVTVDWRGVRVMTGVIVTHEVAKGEDGVQVLNMSGLDALAYVGYSLAWPQPSQGIASQALWPSNPGDAPPIRAVGDAAVLTMIRDNMVGRRTQNVVVAASHNIGSTVSIRPAFDNLLELALRKATRAGIGLKATIEAVGANGVDSTDGILTVRAYQPADRSVRIVFDDDDGSIGSWTRTRTAPAVSRVVVSGVQGKYRLSGRNATGWNPTREQFVQGPASFDDTELDEAADEALDAGEPTVDVRVVASETPSQRAFVDYQVGDTATARLGSQTLVDTITAIGVKVDENGPVVTPVFGDPDGIDPRDAQARRIRDVRRNVDKQKRRT